MLTAEQRYRAGRGTLGVMVVLVGLTLLPAGAAAAPPNDDFADATEIAGLPAEATGSHVGATVEPDEPFSGERSIWYRWTAPADGGITVGLGGCAPPFQDSVTGSYILNVYLKSPVFGMVRVEGSIHATAGRTYWISIGSAPGEPADPDICLQILPGPENDDFARATPLTGFPVDATQPSSAEGGATREAGEPRHEGEAANPQGGSVWYSWAAPAARRVRLRVCGTGGAVAIYTGNRVGALTHIATRRLRERRCGSLWGASVTFNAVQGEVYRIAVASAGPPFRLLLGNQVAVLAGRTPAFFYTAFPGQRDDVELRLTGSGRQRALLLEADGVPAANGCEADVALRRLRCPVPGKAPLALEIDLRDGNDAADVRLLGTARLEEEGTTRRVLGGDGNDTLAGSAGSDSPARGWEGGLMLSGGPGADRLAGGPGSDWLGGGPGPDTLDPGNGDDAVDGGPGDDRVRTIDPASDSIRCQAGRDRIRLDGIDLSQGCEHRKLDDRARAVAILALIGNYDGEGEEHLDFSVACPIDVEKGCRSRVTPIVPGKRRISRRLKVAPGRVAVARFFRFDEEQLLRRGVRVTVQTRRGGRTLNFTDHLATRDDRYLGEG